MRIRNAVSRASFITCEQPAKPQAIAIVTYINLLILAITLFPFNFSFDSGFSFAEIIRNFRHSTYLGDFLVNILLFLPFGFSCKYLFSQTRFQERTILVIVLIAGTSLSLTIELLQAYLPSRSSTISDVLANTLGTLLGSLCFNDQGLVPLHYFSGTLSQLKRFLGIKFLLLCLAGYIALILSLSIHLLNTTSLRNWDSNFPLLLGNEQTGDRPWSGSIAQVSIFDNALSSNAIKTLLSSGTIPTIEEHSLVASYVLTKKNDYYNDQSNHLPPLIWQGDLAEPVEEKGVPLSPDRWLKTTGSVTSLSQHLIQASAFTLYAAISTADIQQIGPARIISLSSNPYQRNFTLGQEGKDIVLRLRTPATGKNGQAPEFIVPNVLLDTKLHHILITYSGADLCIYLDKVKPSSCFAIMPGVALSQYLWHSHISSSSIGAYKVLYYTLIFTPLGIILALINKQRSCSFFIRIGFISSSILFSALVVEGVLAIQAHRPWILENLILSLTIATATLFLFHFHSRYWEVNAPQEG